MQLYPIFIYDHIWIKIFIFDYKTRIMLILSLNRNMTSDTAGLIGDLLHQHVVTGRSQRSHVLDG
jgi:hypothetical protein